MVISQDNDTIVNTESNEMRVIGNVNLQMADSFGVVNSKVHYNGKHCFAHKLYNHFYLS